MALLLGKGLVNESLGLIGESLALLELSTEKEVTEPIKINLGRLLDILSEESLEKEEEIKIEENLISLKNYYFTFGSNHVDKEGHSLGDSYVKIQASDMIAARVEMFNIRGSIWSFCYEEEEFLPQIEHYGLHEISAELI